MPSKASISAIQAKSALSPEQAVITYKVDPRRVDPLIFGHHQSYGRNGFRYWFFHTPQGAAKFRELYKEFLK